MEVSPVSHFLLLGNSKERKTKGSCGRNFRGWSQRLNLVGCWLKTYLESLPLPLIASARTWKVKATASGYSVMKLSLSVPRTRDHECSFVAHSNSERELQPEGCVKDIGGRVSNSSEEADSSTYSNSQRCQKQRLTLPESKELGGIERCSRWQSESRMGRAVDGLSPWMDRYWDWGIPKVAKGIPNRVARLKALGNAVVPAQVIPIFKAIMEVDKEGL